MRLTSVKDYEKALSGGEPSWKNGELSLTRALNWYNYHSDTKESKKFALSYLKEIEASDDVIETLSKVSDVHFQNLGFVCRMKLRGAPITESNDKWIDSFFNTLKGFKETSAFKVEAEEIKVVSIQERVADISREHIGEMEAMIDDCITQSKFKWDSYTWMQAANVKGAHTKFIVEFFERRIEELDEVLKGKDKDLVEGYSNFTKAQLKEYITLLKTICSDAQKIAHNSKLIRAPRKKKAKPVDKVVSKLNYKKDDNGYKLASINPIDIVGCSQLWVFNTKSRKLGVYNADDSGGLSVKGSTIINYKQDTSAQKTVRKPEALLPEVLKAGKISLRKILPGINSVEQELTGRINDDTILLRVIK
jgi:hypothetical protein